MSWVQPPSPASLGHQDPDVRVRILALPLRSCMTLCLSFPIWKTGVIRVPTQLGCCMDSGRKEVDTKHSINVSRHCDYYS